MEVYSTGFAAHTSATTQLDAGVHDALGWTTFVPSNTIPANTSINFRFRTSTDAATWGSWTASTASTDNIDIAALLGAGDAAKRYLQVETTLANTDGISTPTLDAYTANYDYTDAPAPTCSDGIQNGDETGVDCGGSCDACPSCSDGIQNQDETGIDCGGTICDACPVPPTCSDGIQNGDETGVDTGGSCPPTTFCQFSWNFLNGEWLCGDPNCTFVDHMTITPSNVSMTVNSNKIFVTKLYKADGSLIVNGTVTWETSSGTLIDNGNDSANYTAPTTPGSYTITAKTCNDKSITATIHVYAASACLDACGTPGCPKCPVDICKGVDHIKLLAGVPDSGVYSGDTIVLTADLMDSNGSVITNPAIVLEWMTDKGTITPSSDNSRNATYVTSATPGDYYIRVSACDKSDVYHFSVKPDFCRNACGIVGCPDCPSESPIAPLCIRSFCINIPNISDGTLTTLSTLPLGLAGLLGLISLLLASAINLLTMVRPSQLLALLLKGKNKKHALGIVYDSASGMGIPLAKVMLIRSRDKKLLSTVISDIDGRFALETPPGEEYFVAVKKEGYDQMEAAGGLTAGSGLAYEDNYFGGVFRTSEAVPIFDKPIPLRANQESDNLAKVVRLFESLSKILRIINIPITMFGFVVTIIATRQSPTLLNKVIFGIYIIIILYFIYNWIRRRGRSIGLVYKTADNQPVDLAIVRAINEMSGKLERTTVTGMKGAYILPLKKGYYKILVSKVGLEQETKLTRRVASNYAVTNERVGLRTAKTNIAPAVEKKIVPNPNRAERFARSSNDIIEAFNQKQEKFGTQDLNNLGVNHLVREQSEPKTMEEGELIIPKDNEIDGRIKPPQQEHPNWQMPNPRTPL
jgi:hypothetical protein